MDEFTVYDSAGTSMRSGRPRTTSINTVPARPYASTSRLEPQNGLPILRNRDSVTSMRSLE